METIKNIRNDLEQLKQVVTDIRNRMVDVDMILTSEEEERFEDSIREYKEGKSIPLEEFEKEVK